LSTHTVLGLLAGLRSVVYVTCFVWLFAWLALSVRRFDASFAVTWSAASGPVALVLMAVGAALGLTCVGFFVARGRGTPALFDPPREFVAVGPYRYVRNPMYVGGLTLLAGFGVWHRSVSILLFALLAFVTVHLLVLFHEEPSLERKFGRSYLDYKRSVNRWWPRRKRESE
jgi:protein-S-isoprenylcysteine O-methyltransferase Ste14